MKKGGVALNRIDLLFPFLDYFQQRGGQLEQLPALNGIDASVFADKRNTLNLKVTHQIIEQISQVLNNPYAGFYIGQELALKESTLFAKQLQGASCLSQALTATIAQFDNLTAGVEHYLFITSKIAVIYADRPDDTDHQTSQADACYIGFITALMKRWLGKHWQESSVLIKVFNADVIPATRIASKQIVQGERKRMAIQVPCEWMFLDKDKQLDDKSENKTLFLSYPQMVEQYIQQNLLDDQLCLAGAATYCGVDSARLKTELLKHNTHFSACLLTIKMQQASLWLVEDKLSINEIAALLTYKSASNFSRAFKTWSGKTPLQYKKSP